MTGLALLLGRRLLDLLRFRPRAKPRVAWSDAHKVLGLVTAAALLVFAWTGAQLCLIEDLARPSLVRAIFDGDEAAAARSLGMTPRPSPAGTPGELPDLAAALATAREALPDVRHGRFVIANLGNANVTVDVGGEDHATLSIFSRVRLDGSGAVTSVLAPGGTTTHAKVSFPFYGLHFAKWADGATRIAYAVLALLGALCILTGNLWWLARRGRRALVDRLLARLTAGVCAGLALAVAVLFLANQLLPRDLASRPALEEAAFFTTWGVVVVTALLAPATRIATHTRRPGAGGPSSSGAAAQRRSSTGPTSRARPARCCTRAVATTSSSSASRAGARRCSRRPRAAGSRRASTCRATPTGWCGSAEDR